MHLRRVIILKILLIIILVLMSELFKTYPQRVRSRSGFDKSHENLITGKVGTLIPVLSDEVIDGTRVHLRSAVAAALPPLASDTFMRCNLHVEAFFVPTAGLYGGFKDFASGKKVRVSTSLDPGIK